MWKTIQPKQIQDNPFKLISKQGLLLAVCQKHTGEDAADLKPCAIKVNWGSLGVLWNKSVATIYLRPSQHTKNLDEEEDFALCVLPQKYTGALGSGANHSGKEDYNLSLLKLDVDYMNAVPWIKQSRLVLFCQKLYTQEIDPLCFSQEHMLKQNYRKNDFHIMYIAEIVKVMQETRG